MKTKQFSDIFKSKQEIAIRRLAEQSNSIGILPTDTLYGLVCLAASHAAVKRLYSLKARENKPGTVIAANIEQLVRLGIKARYLKAVQHLWPNPLSIEIPHQLAYLNQDTGRQAFRIPKNTPLSSGLLQILDRSGPLLTTSANLSGESESTNIKQAMAYFGDKVDFYVDGGDLSGNKPSTIIRIIDDEVDVVREGAVKIDKNGRIT